MAATTADNILKGSYHKEPYISLNFYMKIHFDLSKVSQSQESYLHKEKKS